MYDAPSKISLVEQYFSRAKIPTYARNSDTEKIDDLEMQVTIEGIIYARKERPND